MRRWTMLSTDAVGFVTLVMGVALTARPRGAGTALGLGASARTARAIGVADLALVPVLLNRHHSRVAPMVLRASLNGCIAAVYLRETRRPGASDRAFLGAIVMSGLTLVDGAIAIGLRASAGSVAGRGMA